MHLKSLTLKGFKSFASSTKLSFEPGITAVVGPNGSGKSNVVDAMAWVLGEQGAKALRGGKMHDVIFAGTADRSPLGRAEVTLVIDNRDNALPIDYDEVSITRRMFRDGAGEYEINGKACRLLDIQELLSDSGIGREMHVIVSQGHLDAVLSARPEDRRAFIEEAAGVLKHRKRKEKALRKLDGMQANLTRLTDLTTELRRQLGPLGKQAEVARRAAGVQADLRDANLRLLADDLAVLQAEIAADAEAEQAAVEHQQAVADQLESAKQAEQDAAAALAGASPAVNRAQDSYMALSALAERFRGTTSLAAERARNLAVPLDHAGTGRDPDELESQADAADVQQVEKDQQVSAARQALTVAIAERARGEELLTAADRELADASRAIADRREGMARLAGDVAGARSRLGAGEDELDRLAVAITDATARGESAQQQFDLSRASVGDLDSFEVELNDKHETAATAAAAAQERVAELSDARRASQSRQTELRARVDALAMGLDRRDAASALLADDVDVNGVLGSVASLITVTPGAEAAIAAALGRAADAIAAQDVPGAADAIALLKRQDAGRAGILVGGARPVGGSGATRDLPSGARWALELITVPDALSAATAALLADVVVVEDLPAATALLGQHPDLVAATRGGDLIGSHWAYGGSEGRQSVMEIQAAVDDARSELAVIETRICDLDDTIAAARTEAEGCAEAAERSLAALHESDARIAAVAEQLAELGSAARSAHAEAGRLTERREAAVVAEQDMRRQVVELEQRLEAARSAQGPGDLDTTRRDELAAALTVDRHSEVQARLALRTVEERAQSTAGRGERLRRQAQAEREARDRAHHAAVRRASGARLAERVVTLARHATERVDESVRQATAERDEATARRALAEQEAGQSRERANALQKQWDALTSSVHSTEVARAQQTMRFQQLADSATEQYGIGTEELIKDYGPEVLVPPSAAEMAEYEAVKHRGENVSRPVALPFDRPSTERRAKRAQRDLNALGRVNPLALEEFAAMEERHTFLATQLDDLRETRKDLLAVVTQVDEKIEQVFESAYRDVAREFEIVFATLFPGGEGSLHLTDPDSMLTTGIDVTARPPGKRVKRLSLLSGGERSLVAVAMLVAIFRARPSPFYVLDEIEAALDEVNLTRLVGLLRELRESSQLLVITHQKYTMEAADVLYGVSMRGDGISQVISQRLRRGDGAAPAGGAALEKEATGEPVGVSQATT